MSFFIKKRGTNRTKDGPQQKKRKLQSNLRQEILSSDESDGGIAETRTRESDSEEEETAAEKKLRLTKEFISQLKAEEAKSHDDELITNEAISERLKQDHLALIGKLQRQVADKYIQPEEGDIRVLRSRRAHHLPVTSVAITPDGKYIFSAAKDCNIVKWCAASGKKVHVIHHGRKPKKGSLKDRGDNPSSKSRCGHQGHILTLAVSSDGKFLAAGDRAKQILIWDPDTCELLHTFHGHRDAVSGLVFQRGSHSLYSCSNDRIVKLWNLDEMGHVENLFGHEDAITGIDSLNRETALTAGGRDASIRLWKIPDEKQLVFRAHGACIDCVSYINDFYFVSGSDDNCLCLWSHMKKKPLVTVSNAHTGNGKRDNWISAVKALPHTDLVASGSSDGFIRFWQCSDDFKKMTELFSIPVNGTINRLEFSQDGSMLVAAVGQEHRMGRWWRLKEAKNSVVLIPLKLRQQ